MKYFSLLIILSALFISCSQDDDCSQTYQDSSAMPTLTTAEESNDIDYDGIGGEGSDIPSGDDDRPDTGIKQIRVK